MNSPNSNSNGGKMEALEKKLSEMDEDKREKVREIEQMFMEEWVRDREPEYKPGPEDAERALEYALGFIDKGKPILILDRSGESSALASTLEHVLKPYNHFLRSVSSLDEAVSFASQLKFRLVIADAAPEDKKFKSGFLGQIKSNYETTSTVLILGQEDEIVDTRVIDAVIRKPFDPTDERIVRQINYYCIVGDIREKRKNIDAQKYEIVVKSPELNFFQYQHLLEHNTHDIEILLSSSFDFSGSKPEVTFRGDAEYPGAATGKVYASFQRAMHSGMLARNLIFYVDDLSDVSLQEIKILRGAGGIVFGNISRLNHHVIDFRSAGIPMIHCKRVPRNKDGNYEKGEFAARDGTKISFDGGSGEIYTGNFEVRPSPITNRLFEDDTETVAEFDSLMRSCDEVLNGRMTVMINADNVETVEAARKFGSSQVGLVRSENVLKEKPENIHIYGAYLLAQITGNQELIEKTREPFKKMQEDAFYDILKYQGENRTQIRLLDPPLNEFFDNEIIDKIAKEELPEAGKEHVQKFKDDVNNPAMQKSDRGVVLGAKYPGIYEAQIDAIFAAYQRLKDEGQENIDLKIFIPYVINLDQIRLVKGMAETLNAQRYGGKVDYNLGVTLETVSGVMNAERMLEMGIRHFTFGTNDLFPMIESSERDSTSRDDYHLDEQGNLIMNPAIVDTMRLCLKRMAGTGVGRDQYEVGISGEMNPIKLENLKELMPALNYVSASRPSQVPVIKLKLAQIYVRQHTGDMKP